MAVRTRFVVAAVFLMLAFVGGWVSAQVFPVVPVTPTVLSGENVGFRVEGYRGNVAVGKIVILLDGEWVEAEIGGGVRRLTSQ